ncbi:hypothetical protein [Streptomyces sp. NPDC102437]|uniref:hypothetical protein n=1 Tax=Streptomyces sp. NPDC102437 TaxID=3366175 RepID=UPI003803458E
MSINEVFTTFLWALFGILAGGSAAIAGLMYAQAQDKKKGQCSWCNHRPTDHFGS